MGYLSIMHTANRNKPLVWIGLNCIMNKDPVDCMVTLTVLQSKESNYFYEHFASVRDRSVLRSKRRRDGDAEVPETVLASKQLAVKGRHEVSIKLTLEVFSPMALDACDENEQRCDDE